jgi:hypothetical protein
VIVWMTGRYYLEDLRNERDSSRRMQPHFRIILLLSTNFTFRKCLPVLISSLSLSSHALDFICENISSLWRATWC